MKIPPFVQQNYKKLIFPIIYTIVLIGVIIYIHPTFWQTINLLSGSSILIYLISSIKNKELKTFKFIKLCITTYISILLIVSAIKWLGAYGIIGFVLIVIFFGAYKIYKQRKFFMEGMREIETMIFGKSLDKKNWDKGELKNGNKH